MRALREPTGGGAAQQASTGGGVRRALRALGVALNYFLFGDGFIVAGYVAFTAVFALFPFLIFLLTLAGYFGHDEAAGESIKLALELFPVEVSAVLDRAILDVRTGATRGLMTFSIFVSVWVASSGVESIRVVLDRAYGFTEHRNPVLLRIQSILLTVLAAALMIVAFVALVGAPLVREVMTWLDQQQMGDNGGLAVGRRMLGLGMVMVTTLTLHILLPDARLSLRDVAPGVLLSVALWALAAELYSAYLRYVPAYSVTYGSLGGVVLTLFFFYISAAILILGAQFNGALRRQASPA